MTFALDSNPTPSQVSEAINYVLANLNYGVPPQNNAISSDPVTGIISDTLGNIIQYQYRYLDIKFADNVNGLNFSDNPYGRQYFGIHNSDTIGESTNPADYLWVQAAGGFGINKVLWLAVTGGRHVTYGISQDAPDANQNWQIAPVQEIDLDNPFKTYDQYMTIRFADDTVGTGFSTSQTNKKFYGIATTSDGSIPTDPTVFEWSPFDFGTTYQLYYKTYGGRNVSFTPSTYQPIGFVPYANLVINLDVPTTASVTTLGIISTAPLTVQSPYRYLIVRYADDAAGTNITTDPDGKTYYGLQPSDVVIIDANPADYTWFAAGETLSSDMSVWVRVSGENIATFQTSADAPDLSGWFNMTSQTDVSSPHVDLYSRTGSVVTALTSPTDGRIGYSIPSANGIINLNLDPYGQGKDSGGFEIDITTTATVSVDQFGRVYQTGAADEIRYSSLVTSATSGQTVFTMSNYQPNQIMVFRNGCFLTPGTDYTRTTTDITLTDACVLNDVVQIYYIRLIDGATSNDKVPFVTTTLTLTHGQTSIPSSYIDGSEYLFINGALIVDTDYQYLGGNTGYSLNTPATGGTCVIVGFSYTTSNILVFNENYTETISGSTNIVFPTPFYRNSSLIWLNGALLRPSSDYTIPGADALSYNYTSIGFAAFSGQPTQYMSFKSAGSASAFGLGSAGVLGYDMPVEIEKKPTIKDLFDAMQAQIDDLKYKLEQVTK